MIRFSSLRWSPISARCGRRRLEVREILGRHRCLCQAKRGLPDEVLHLAIARQVAVLVEIVRYGTALDRGAYPHLVLLGGMAHPGNHRHHVGTMPAPTGTPP